MAWTVTPMYQGPNWNTFFVTSDDAADVTVGIPHTLNKIPLFSSFVALNQEANEAGFFIAGATDAVLTLEKLPGVAAGAAVHLNIANLAHPH